MRWCRVCGGDQRPPAVNHDAFRVQDRTFAYVHRQGPWIKIDIEESLARPVTLLEVVFMPGDQIALFGHIAGRSTQYPRCYGRRSGGGVGAPGRAPDL